MTTATEDSKGKITPTTWAEIEAKWTSGEYTLSMLEEEYGLRRETFSRYFKKKGLAKGADAVGKMVRESLKSDAEIRAKERATKIDDRKNKFDSWAFVLARMTMSQVVTAKAEGKTLAMIEGDLKTLQRASNTLAKCYEISSKALGMDKDDGSPDEIPNLVFGELTQKQVEELRSTDEGDLEKEDAMLAEVEREMLSESEDDSESISEDDDGVA